MVVGLATSASAGINLFAKKPKPVPEKRVPELLVMVKTDGDENKRYEAAEELRQYDPTLFPQIVPTLIEPFSTWVAPSHRKAIGDSICNNIIAVFTEADVCFFCTDTFRLL